MYRTAMLACYDVMSEVHITATVRLYDGMNLTGSETEFHCSTTVDGVGSSDGRDWLRDALVAMIEAL